MNNKLFCSFLKPKEIESFCETTNKEYEIQNKKFFIFYIPQENKYITTYNILYEFELKSAPEESILVHRKKDSNTIYTLNALNSLIKEINNGILDKSLVINWENYKNTFILNQNSIFKKFQFKLHKIISL
jgi:hypothetical protein